MTAWSALSLSKARLSSGLRVVCAPLPHTHRSAVSVHVLSGSRFEPPELGGISHFLEHMLHRGTRRHPSAYTLALAFEELGSELGAATYVDHLLLTAEAPPHNLNAVIALLGEVVADPVFSAIELERGIVREEILESLNEEGDPIDADELVCAMAFENHALGRPIAGKIETLDRFDVAALARFHRAHYRASGMVVSVSGPVDPSEIHAVVERAFGGVGDGAPPDETAPEAFSGPRFRAVQDPGSQVALRAAFRAPREGDPLEPATEILLRIIDDGMSTRLYHRICDECGLSYDVSASYEAFSDSGLLTLATDVAPERAERLIDELFRVVRTLASEGPSEPEIDKAKRRYGWQIQALLDSPLELSAFVGLGALTSTAETPLEREAELLRVDASAVQRAAQRVFCRENLAVAAVGPLTAKQRRALERVVESF